MLISNKRNRNQIAVAIVIIKDAKNSKHVKTLNGVILTFPSILALFFSSRDIVYLTIRTAIRYDIHNKIVIFQITSFSS